MTGKNKTILIAIILLVVLGIVFYLYFWYQNTNKLRKQALEQIGKSQQYDVVSNEIGKEKTRCEQFISQETGQFGEFEYCQRFIQWQNIFTAPKQ